MSNIDTYATEGRNQMKELNRKLKRSESGADETGFTLFELLIVIVVLGILAAIVVFALSGVTSKSATAACQSDSKTVGVAVAALQAENPGAWNSYTSAQWKTELLLNSTAVNGLTGGPFLQSWPQGNSTTYKISVSPGGQTTNDTTQKTANGDVVVSPQNTTHIFNATLFPTNACKNL